MPRLPPGLLELLGEVEEAATRALQAGQTLDTGGQGERRLACLLHVLDLQRERDTLPLPSSEGQSSSSSSGIGEAADPRSTMHRPSQPEEQRQLDDQLRQSIDLCRTLIRTLDLTL